MLATRLCTRIKRSNKIERAHEWQVKYYIYVLEQTGIEGVSGILEYPLCDIQPGLHFPITTVQKSRRWREKLSKLSRIGDLSTCYQCKNLQKLQLLRNFVTWKKEEWKRTYYLFNPGTLQRKDNTLRFTPMEEDGNGNQQEDNHDTYRGRYCRVLRFRRTQCQRSLWQLFGAKRNSRHFFDYYEIIPVHLCLATDCFRAKCFWHKHHAHSNKKKRNRACRKICWSRRI